MKKNQFSIKMIDRDLFKQGYLLNIIVNQLRCLLWMWNNGCRFPKIGSKTAKFAGFYQSQYMSQSCDKIQIVTVRDIIENQKRLNIRLSLEVVKSAEKQKEVKGDQMELDFDY